jgi:hypothetical protein
MTNDNQQPEALRCAEKLDKWARDYATTWDADDMATDAAAELRRLHQVNAELVEALKELLFEEETQDNGLTEAVIMSSNTAPMAQLRWNNYLMMRSHDEFIKFMRESVRSYESAKEKARKAIANATGENNG